MCVCVCVCVSAATLRRKLQTKLSITPTVCWYQANLSQYWPYNTRRLFESLAWLDPKNSLRKLDSKPGSRGGRLNHWANEAVLILKLWLVSLLPPEEMGLFCFFSITECGVHGDDLLQVLSQATVASLQPEDCHLLMFCQTSPWKLEGRSPHCQEKIMYLCFHRSSDHFP